MTEDESNSGDVKGEEPVAIPITDELDLHTFRPRDVKDVVEAYLEACREKGIHRVRIVHGKGIGALRETVHALLKKHPDVVSFALAGEAFGGWGATMATLKPMEPEERQQTSETEKP